LRSWRRGLRKLAKYYWLLSDGKTVREISWEEYHKINMENWKRETNLKLICYLDNSFFQARRGKKYVTVHLRQLKQILNGENVG